MDLRLSRIDEFINDIQTKFEADDKSKPTERIACLLVGRRPHTRTGARSLGLSDSLRMSNRSHYYQPSTT